MVKVDFIYLNNKRSYIFRQTAQAHGIEFYHPFESLTLFKSLSWGRCTNRAPHSQEGSTSCALLFNWPILLRFSNVLSSVEPWLQEAISNHLIHCVGLVFLGPNHSFTSENLGHSWASPSAPQNTPGRVNSESTWLGASSNPEDLSNDSQLLEWPCWVFLLYFRYWWQVHLQLSFHENISEWAAKRRQWKWILCLWVWPWCNSVICTAWRADRRCYGWVCTESGSDTFVSHFSFLWTLTTTIHSAFYLYEFDHSS